MHQIDSRSEYQVVLAQLRREFADEIGSGAALSVANHLVADVQIIDETPVVLDAIEYEGAKVETLDRCLCPLSILQYSTASVDPEKQSTKWIDLSALAATVLARDLNSPSEYSEDGRQSSTQNGRTKAADAEDLAR